MKNFIIRFIFVFSLFWNVFAHAGNPDKGWAAYESGDWETALKELTPLAKNGPPNISLAIGLIYQEFNNLKEAIKWFKQSYEKGSPDAGYMFAISGLSNSKLGINEEEIFNAMKFSADNSSEDFYHSRCILASFYADGFGLPAKDIKSAVAFAKNCLREDFPYSFLIMSVGEEDINKSCMWFYIYADIVEKSGLPKEEHDLLEVCNLDTQISQTSELLARKCKNSNYRDC